ncbi:hypothetical protein NP439_15730 [Oceanobacillus jeddahense]|uniref:DUF3139 domain-containing protein n=1 Tax=Oceanobacillus jeddahense TaxID=1462527 RepID=A0ABY5JPT9_9BACI|nr:hypothetical protein [Oceanobacillus jeddahense]UUI01497.1 hypothetical protein NP439_15730 [Oceanobacillus jeddahense]
MEKQKKTRYIVSVFVLLAAVIVLAVLYTIEINKTITTPELIEELLVKENLEEVNSEASADSLSEIQNLVRSEGFKSSSNYLELNGERTNYIVQFRYEENREIRILGIEESPNE